MPCGYNISGLKGLLTALPSYISVIGYTAHVASCERVDVKNVQFEGESELNGTYAFGKKLTVTVTRSGESLTKVFDLNGLTLKSA